ncbi:hypothetical protein GA0070624_6552 [Micromonospora rhizosphaerae]|uniref:Uncharacterized protein n=1 Tax=Micromonospora rhizosphaerae TaxID=568872 RepID=A0A1C6TC97_9ACTN|nr:hypothetical protein [Micromonospora rhizosphaerae]SCL39398.1 hypothetical protein GA0070624_6552 [Micromonospora rhizosphaerae]
MADGVRRWARRSVLRHTALLVGGAGSVQAAFPRLHLVTVSRLLGHVTEVGPAG